VSGVEKVTPRVAQGSIGMGIKGSIQRKMKQLDGTPSILECMTQDLEDGYRQTRTKNFIVLM
jgi:hypothetical protein